VAERDQGRLAPLERWTKLGMETGAQQRLLASERGNGNAPQRHAYDNDDDFRHIMSWSEFTNTLLEGVRTVRPTAEENMRFSLKFPCLQTLCEASPAANTSTISYDSWYLEVLKHVTQNSLKSSKHSGNSYSVKL